MNKNNNITILDIFAGAGGFSLGFEQAGAKIVGAVEIDAWASETFQVNHPDAIIINEDITQLNDKRLLAAYPSAPDIILGGPPCQGFSICNKNNGDPKDPRNSLFMEFLRVGRLFEPRIMIMENVPNLMNAKTSEGIPVVDIIKIELHRLGYHVYSDILDATRYGVPQIRRRLFIVASKTALHCPFPATTHIQSFGKRPSLYLLETPTLWDAISDLPEIEAREGAEELNYTKKPLNDYQRELRADCNIVFNHKAMNHSKRLVERFASMSCGDSTIDVSDEFRPLRRNSNEYSDKAYGQNNRRMHPDRPCHTIAASFYANFVHPYKNRNFTAREGARIQSFPDNFIFKGKPTVVSHKLLQRECRLEEKHLCQYNQIGNAVPPLVARAIANNLLKQLVV